MNNCVDFEKMRRLSADIRIETIKGLTEAGFGHIGGSASIAEVLGVLYGGVMKIDPANPDWEDRDWFVLSKGHAGPALYAALGIKGYFPKEWLKTINKPGTSLPSHADRLKTPGVDMTTGSLGQGLSCAVGIALSNRLKKKDSYTYCIMGDGEIQEGQIWEGAQTAAHFKLGSLIAFVDSNQKQIDGTTEEINNPFDTSEKFRSFGWDVYEVNGHNVEKIYHAIQLAKAVKEKPSVINLKTIKGFGVNFAEKESFNHYMNMDWDMAEKAIEEIEERYAQGNYPGGDK